jgi:RES domain-containing protein
MSPTADLVAFRYSSYDVPFWVRPNRLPQRWNRAYDGPTQYWSLTPDGAWAELVRSEGLRDEAELDLIRMPIWACRLSSMSLLDLSDPGVLRQYDLRPENLIADEWATCQQAGTKMRADGVRGILTPSAALAGATSLTLFGPRRAIALGCQPALASTIPASVVAIGRPPRNLLQRVIHRAAAGRLFDW